MASNFYSREHEGPSAGAQAGSMASAMKDKAADAAASVQETAGQAYETAREAVEQRPILFSVVAAGVIGFALGALWRMRTEPTATERALGMVRGYAEPSWSALKNARWR